MTVMVRVPFGMAWCVGGGDSVEEEGATLGELWQNLHARYPDLMSRLSLEQGTPSEWLRVSIDGQRIESLDNLDIELRNGAYVELTILAGSAALGH